MLMVMGFGVLTSTQLASVNKVQLWHSTTSLVMCQLLLQQAQRQCLGVVMNYVATVNL